jgi:hypothetical protein
MAQDASDSPAVSDETPSPAQTSPAQTSPVKKSALGDAIAADAAKRAAGELPEKTPVDEYLENYIGLDDIARASFLAPPSANSVSKDNNVWVNRKQKRIYADGYVAMREGALEMFACPTGSKEHESAVATLARSRELHAALLAVGAKPGSPVKFRPEYVPPSGDVIRVWVCWRDAQGEFQVADARAWVLKNGTEDEQMDAEWVFGGSGFWKDPVDGREYYRADGGDMICVSNFTTAMLDVNTPSSADAGSLDYLPFTKRMPERGTPVRLILQPVAEKDAPIAKPTESVLPINPLGAKLREKKIAADKAYFDDE